MAGTEAVVTTLVALQESGDPRSLANVAQRLATTGQNLVWIALVADVPHQRILRRIEAVVQGERELHRTETRSQMAAARRHRLQQKVAQFVCEWLQSAARQGAQRGRIVDALEQAVLDG